MKIVVISPHPDDDVIGLGGTIAKLASEGHEVISIYVTDGRGSIDAFNLGPDRLADRRKEEAKAAARILGIKKTIFLGFKDKGVNSNFSREVLKKLQEEILSIIHTEKPDRIYIPHPKDGHIAHRQISITVLEALRNDGYSCDVLGYEVWTPIEKPDTFVDITDVVNIKRKSIQAHKTQVAYLAYDEGILALNKYRAFQTGRLKPGVNSYVEAFVKLISANKP